MTLKSEIESLANEIEMNFPNPSVDVKFVEENFDYLPLFSAEEFHRNLRAYLLRSLRIWNPDDNVCEFTIYGLSPSKDYKSDKYWKDRYKLFNKYQIELILKFIGLVEKDERFDFIFSQVKRSTKRILELNDEK